MDKKLSGVATVQTLSRLNRTYPGKDWTVVLDFVNDPEEVLAGFLKYYTSASLPEVTDPNLIYALQVKLDSQDIYLDSEINAFATFWWNPKKGQTHFQLQRLLQPSSQRFKVQYRDAFQTEDKTAKDALELFVKDLASFCKLFEFLCQIFDYSGDSELEKRYAFFKEIYPILSGIIREGRSIEDIDLSDVRLSHHSIRQRDPYQMVLGGGTVAEFPPSFGELGSGTARDPERVRLLELIEQLNLLFEGELSDTDLVNYAYGVRDKLMENGTLRSQARANTKQQFDESDELRDAILTAVEEQNEVNSDLARQVLNDSRVRDAFMQIIRDLAYEGFLKGA